MYQDHPFKQKNLFEIANARNLSRDELLDTFVPTEGFWRLLSPKHHVVLGSRGSGKTALAKMLSHDHLSRMSDGRAAKIVESRSLIGTYVSTDLEWACALGNKHWLSVQDQEMLFQWRLNLSSCRAFLKTAQSCADAYIADSRERILAEELITAQLSSAWCESTDIGRSFGDLKDALELIDYSQGRALVDFRVKQLSGLPVESAGKNFGLSLFAPLKRAISILTNALNIPEDAAWLLCLDEAEYLEPWQHRILNSHMRANSGRLFFKITTMPYCHYTLETALPVSVDVGHDFEYVYIDVDPTLFAPTSDESGKFGTLFGRSLFNKRAEASGLSLPPDIANSNPRPSRRARPSRVSNDASGEMTMTQLLGRSRLLDPTPEDWAPRSANMKLLTKYCTDETVNRAHALSGTALFMDSIGRKLHGALLLRHEWETRRGHDNTELYSGVSMVIRCSDANPRRLIRIFNALLLPLMQKARRNVKASHVPPKEQSRILYKLASSTLDRLQSEPDVGPALHRFLIAIGQYMQWHLHEKLMATDQVSSVKLTPTLTDKQWQLVTRAVGLGLLYPNVAWGTDEELPVRSGTFHLAFILAPYFFLLPRRGKSRALSSMVANMDEADNFNRPLIQTEIGLNGDS